MSSTEDIQEPMSAATPDPGEQSPIEPTDFRKTSKQELALELAKYGVSISGGYNPYSRYNLNNR